MLDREGQQLKTLPIRIGAQEVKTNLAELAAPLLTKMDNERTLQTVDQTLTVTVNLPVQGPVQVQQPIKIVIAGVQPSGYHTYVLGEAAECLTQLEFSRLVDTSALTGWRDPRIKRTTVADQLASATGTYLPRRGNFVMSWAPGGQPLTSSIGEKKGVVRVSFSDHTYADIAVKVNVIRRVATVASPLSQAASVNEVASEDQDKAAGANATPVVQTVGKSSRPANDDDPKDNTRSIDDFRQPREEHKNVGVQALLNSLGLSRKKQA